MSQQRTVLIVDDEEICLSITSKMVEKIGLPVITARDGIEALEIYQHHVQEIGCVLMDIQMPRMNGIEAFGRMKSICGDVQVVIASGFLNDTNQRLLDPLKPVGYLKKPISFQDLSDIVMKCLQNVEQLGWKAKPAGACGAAAADGQSQ